MKFMAVFHDIEWTKKESSDVCISLLEDSVTTPTSFPRGHWSFLGPGDEEKWYGICNFNPEGM